jgi:hypothetical protein
MTQIELEKSNLEDSPIQANKKCATLQDETDKYTALVIELETKNRELKSHSTDAQGQADSFRVELESSTGVLTSQIVAVGAGVGVMGAGVGVMGAGVEVTVVQV